jgi:hypothetical protein
MLFGTEDFAVLIRGPLIVGQFVGQNREIDDPVLLGADELLARHQKHALAGAIDELERRYAAAFAHFGDGDRFRSERFIEGRVVDRRAVRASQAEDCQAPDGLRLREFDPAEQFGECVRHASLLAQGGADSPSGRSRKFRSSQGCGRRWVCFDFTFGSQGM